jgi:tetratricopeptide (TPR) repeat protein
MASIINYAVLTVFVTSIFSFAAADEVGAKNRRANKLYDKGQYEEALKLYDDALLLEPSNGKLLMNRGSTLYRMGEFDEAEKSYTEALSSRSGNKTLADAHYNLGNIRYKQAEKLEAAGNAASARKKYAGAVESYVNTLKLRPNDMDAKWNLQLAHQKIDVLKDMQDQNQDQSQDKNQDKNQDQNQQNDKQKGDNGEQQDNREQDDKNKDKDNQDNNDGQDNQPQPDKNEGEMEKNEAERLIEQYADDADTLSKPRFQRARIRQPEKDW